MADSEKTVEQVGFQDGSRRSITLKIRLSRQFAARLDRVLKILGGSRTDFVRELLEKLVDVSEQEILRIAREYEATKPAPRKGRRG